MKHKHYDMIVAKAANMDLVVFSQDGATPCSSAWFEITQEANKAVNFHSSCNYFLCLPQHKDACLHWLNGGEVQSIHNDYEPMTLVEFGSIDWGVKSTFMKDSIEIRIKPKKEKRWIVVNPIGNYVNVNLMKIAPDISEYPKGCQSVEIEVEV